MNSRKLRRPPPADPFRGSTGPANVTADGPSNIQLSAELIAELLDPKSWAHILAMYARTTNVAVELVDAEGRALGMCYNPQPVWRLARDAQPETEGCRFCLASPTACTAVAACLRSGQVMMARDEAGLTHVAAPLLLAGRRLGALVAGQVFDRFPEPLPLQRAARRFGVSAQRLWHTASQTAPTSQHTLKVYGELLGSLGDAFLRQRYAEILDRKLAETNRRYRLLIDGVKDYALFTVDTAGRVASWNAGAERLHGYTEAEIVGQDYSLLFTPEDIQAGVPIRELRKTARDGWTEDEGWQVRKDGTRFYANGVLASLGEGDFVEYGRLTRDVSERRRTEQAILQAQKLESIGVLAGGIAHDFNNLLAGILGGISLAKSSLPTNHPAWSMLSIAEESSHRAAGLTSQLLAYAGKGHFVITRFDLSALVA